MLFVLLLLFTVLPLTELALLVWVAGRLSWPWTLAIVLGTGLAGAALARWQGWRTAERIREELEAGRLPAGPLVEGILILLAGAVLITPGVLTDAVGLLLLVGPVRRAVGRGLVAWLKSRFHLQASAGPAGRWPPGGPMEGDGDIVEGEIVEGRVTEGEILNGPDAESPPRPE